MDYGSYSTAQMSDTTARWITVDSGAYYWSTSVTGVMVGSTGYALENSASLVINSGTDYGYLPRLPGRKIMKKLLADVRTFKFFGRYYGPCSTSSYVSLHVLLGSYWVEIPPSSYVKARKQSTEGRLACELKLRLHFNEWFVMGNVLLENYYKRVNSGGK